MDANNDLNLLFNNIYFTSFNNIIDEEFVYISEINIPLNETKEKKEKESRPGF